MKYLVEDPPPIHSLGHTRNGDPGVASGREGRMKYLKGMQKGIEVGREGSSEGMCLRDRALSMSPSLRSLGCRMCRLEA